MRLRAGHKVVTLSPNMSANSAPLASGWAVTARSNRALAALKC